MTKPLGITEVVLRDGHQSLLATRLRLEDMLPIAPKLDEIGFWSIESWGGATFDSCIRYLGEDPWERLRALKKAMPKTKQQMLFRGQNILGYRHYADDVVEKFVERAHVNGIDVFRIFDAMNDVRNLQTAIKSAVKVGAHAQGTLSYTESPVHTLEGWLTMAKQIEDMGAHSLCIKDMSGLLKPYDAEELIARLKETVSLPIALHCHATTGLSIATHMKAIDADVDVIDTSISSMSMTYGHSPTETIVSIVEGTKRDTGLDMVKLAEVATYFREVRKKYAKFEGSLKGIDARILLAQVPGGMLTNMEMQLREQGAADKLDEVLIEIPKVRKDLGYIPLVTPTSQIVGTQAVLNVLTGERYKSITKETAGVLKGEYGATADKVNAELQARVLDGAEAITCRPADLIKPELDNLTAELETLAKEKKIDLADEVIDDVLTYALFPQIGLKFLENRNNPEAFEPVPTIEDAVATSAPAKSSTAPENYAVSVDGKVFDVVVAQGGDISQITQPNSGQATKPSSSASEALNAPLAGNIFKVLVHEGDEVAAGEVVIIMEAMKMETEIRAVNSGIITSVDIKEGDSVAVGQALLSLG
ncbi:MULTISPECIES: sodium-extruding oxaloacetate decarboxylase subunit alpha [unclassified Colwellia]|uniref:sodium-extruding oxaloacetate decarboxylase subunit alpha n=1 Tax=unclassified Colwellia TaxID=196834 RepID=UPI0015F40764|nr:MULTISPECIES: sodium-extruding oxaloacetate decarboxylase subunit alpha [unclassified Colwellia]MBA6232460.1 sodium-extruding oxaloacetate decarboxylase subunit alpha [Colwellia sp. MB02u-7]MBA6238317.1 sodium-extruding oxaloacetate decarboxylase subunit alpha [Colwellia sp. MB02u-11]MBA6254567.1 sodium-extruding oxaloacetate decarboxylase subunit alpha [Colwellia sp. MB3u-28]MBA6258262.1 sodium-extruding oxaloacetate decarboxylase subunit alpha [Colwellia sp. MB3u-41]MBA6301067.1 sodium-ex